MIPYRHNRITIPIRVAVETGSMTARLPPGEKGANACTIGYDMLARVFFALFLGM